MNNFWHTKMSELTVIQGFLWILIYMIFLVTVWAAMLVMPQKAEEIWDALESFFDKVKTKVCGCKIFNK